MTFMSIYMYESLGMSMTQVGLADFITTIVGAGAAYLGAAACDAYGRKKLLITGLALQIISYLLISICIDTHVAIPLFILALAFNSFNGGLYRTILGVMIADVVKPSDLVHMASYASAQTWGGSSGQYWAGRSSCLPRMAIYST